MERTFTDRAGASPATPHRRRNGSHGVQLAQLARFGQYALLNPPLADLMQQAVEIVQRGLGAELCRVLEAGDDDRTLVQSAAFGWHPDWLRRTTFDAVAETEDRFILGARESVVVEDYRSEKRFAASPVQRAHGVRSSVEVLICAGGGSYGVLGAYACQPGRFGADCAHFVQSVANTLAAAIERREAERRLVHTAQFDALTGLPGRGLFADRLAHAVAEAAREQRPMAVLFVDLDRFKLVNDTLGHAAGDQLLEQVASRLTGAVRASDSVGRLGGDEFAVIVHHLSRPDDAAKVAQKIVAALAEPYRLGWDTGYVSASVGIALYPGDAADADSLLNNADAAMYRAKETGRNGYHFFLAEMNARSVQRMRLEGDLRDALARGEFRLHYQPRVSLHDSRVCGLEALLRWQPPGRPLVSPADFIPVLEETGLIVPVGEWVVAEACAQLARWRAEGSVPVPVAVNLSARQFRHPGLDAVIGGIVEKSGVDPGLIEFELTESILMSDAEAAVGVLRRLKARGMRIAIDDFGTGYSSLAYLRRFPLDALKIDRAFVADVTHDADDATITRTIISLARSLGLRVVAEGVETEDQLRFLRTNACDEIQGYLIARPLPAAEAGALLAAADG